MINDDNSSCCYCKHFAVVGAIVVAAASNFVVAVDWLVEIDSLDIVAAVVVGFVEIGSCGCIVVVAEEVVGFAVVLVVVVIVVVASVAVVALTVVIVVVVVYEEPDF